MTEWWTYRPSDLLMFAPRTYFRLFELHNAEVWPLHIAALGAGFAVLALLPRAPSHPRRGAAALALAAAAWAWVGASFVAGPLATIHWAGGTLGAAFVVQALLLGAAALRCARGGIAPLRRAPPAAVLLLAFALLLQPWLGVIEGRSWRAAEVFGIAPDPTVVATLALLAARPLRGGAVDRWLQRAAWLLPLAWCGASAMTLATMDVASWPLLPAAAALALHTAWRDAARGG